MPFSPSPGCSCGGCISCLAYAVTVLQTQITALQTAAAPVAAVAPLRLVQSFPQGGSIASFLGYLDTGSLTVRYWPANVSEGNARYPMVINRTGAALTVRFRAEYSADADVSVVPRVRSAAGSWSSKAPAASLLASASSGDFEVTIQDGEALGLFFVPNGGAVTYTYFYLYMGC